MRPQKTAAITLCLFTTLVAASGSGFKSNEEIAQANSVAPEGSSYDFALGTSMQANPKVLSGMTTCLEQSPGEQSVHGYFYFTSATQYKVELEPRSPFSECLEKALEGHRVPKPPEIPYFNKFNFSTAP